MANADMERCGRTPERRLWHRVHRPEDYVGDVLKYIAGETGVPAGLLMAAGPIARRMVSSWPAAAMETTEYDVFACGRRRLRTVFRISNYSSRAVFQMAEKALRAMGIGAGAGKGDETEFAWVLLGGVLNDYAERAGLRKETTARLLEFRLRNSDYFTMTTWFPECVEIANLDTGRVEYLALPEDDIGRVVDYAVNYLTNIAGRKSRWLRAEDREAGEYAEHLGSYEVHLRKTPPVF